VRNALKRTAAVRTTARGVLGALLFLWSVNGLAEALLASEIRAQPLAAALADFAHQTGLQLVYVSDALKDQQSKGARAGVSTAEALKALLEGTGLTFEFLNQRAVRIFPEPKAAESGEEPKPPVRRPAPAASVANEVDVFGQRDERLRAFEAVQDVPASVSVLSGNFLQEQASVQMLDYASYIPGVGFAVGGAPGANQFLIRGIYPGSGANSAAFYIDDTPIGPTGPYATTENSFSLDLVPYDLERLEVWRGPQGTSIGAESEIGLFRYVLIQPNVNDFHASASADLFTIHGGDQPGGTAYGAANIPLVSGQLAVRLSAFGNYTPGYVDNLYDGAKGINVLRRHGVRLAVVWRPTETFSATLNALSNQNKAQDWSQVTYNRIGQVPNTGNAFFVQPLGSWGDLLDNAPLLSPADQRLDLYSLSLSWTPGAIEVHSATAWSHLDNDFGFDETEGIGSYFPVWSNGTVPAGLAFLWNPTTLSKLSEELHVSSTGNRRVEWMLGAFYTHETGTNDTFEQALDTAGQPISYFAPDLSYHFGSSTYIDEALFGNATWHVTGGFELGAGIRRAHDEQTITGTGGTWNSPPPPSSTLRRSDTDTSWMGSVKYRFNPSTTVYARVATGLQPGYLAPGAAGSNTGEWAVDYDLGLKAAFLESKALVDLTLFYVDQKDIPVFVYPENVYTVTNGARAVSKGFELTSSYAPIPGLQLAYIADFTQAALVSVVPYAAYLLTGYQPQGIPKWTMSATAVYAWPLAGHWQAQIGSGIRWSGQKFGAQIYVQGPACCENYPAEIVPSYWAIDLNAQAYRGPLRLRLYVRNLTDERGLLNEVAVLNQTFLPYEITEKLLQPRTLGVGVDYSF